MLNDLPGLDKSWRRKWVAGWARGPAHYYRRYPYRKREYTLRIFPVGALGKNG